MLITSSSGPETDSYVRESQARIRTGAGGGTRIFNGDECCQQCLWSSDTFYSKNLVDGLVNSDMKKISNKSSLIGTYVRYSSVFFVRSSFDLFFFHESFFSATPLLCACVGSDTFHVLLGYEKTWSMDW